jgi:hypothetical protein
MGNNKVSPKKYSEFYRDYSEIRIDVIYSIAVITSYLLRPLKLTNQNQSQIQSVQLFITFAP